MISMEFLLTSLIVVLIPGTGVIYTISNGITGNRKDGVMAALGCTFGIIPHLVAGMIGLSAIFYAGSLVFKIIKIIGIVYLIYLGLGMILDKGSLTINESDEGIKRKNSLDIIIKGVLINLLNPKLTLFFFSFLPQFINSETQYFKQIIVLSLIFMFLTFIVFICYGLLANYFKNLFINSSELTKKIQKSFGFLFIGLATKLIFSND